MKADNVLVIEQPVVEDLVLDVLRYLFTGTRQGKLGGRSVSSVSTVARQVSSAPFGECRRHCGFATCHTGLTLFSGMNLPAYCRPEALCSRICVMPKLPRPSSSPYAQQGESHGVRRKCHARCLCTQIGRMQVGAHHDV